MDSKGLAKAEPAPKPCRVLSARRIFPTSRPPNGPTTTALSIVDATVARFAPCAAVWLFDANEGCPADTTRFFDGLEHSLRQTLDEYPHFAGQLRWAGAGAGATANPPRLGRPEVTYGSAGAGDPGLELVRARHEGALADLVPSQGERGGARKAWVATSFPQDELLPSCDLAFMPRLGAFEGLPGVSAQVTAFGCGGFAVGVRMTHCLGDALCLVGFVKNWAEKSRRPFGGPGGEAGVVLGPRAASARPVFAPDLLDRHAGNASLPGPDGEKVGLARSLPMHRYDWWATDAPGYPAWAAAGSEATKPSREVLEKTTLTPSTPPPWGTWDMSAPVEHVQLRFSADEVRRLKQAAQAGVPEGHVVSRLDALLAHVWILINRARRPSSSSSGDSDSDGDRVYLDVTLGLRGRVEPPLPDEFVGSPVLLAHVSLPGAQAGVGVGAVALAIRQTMARFTPAAVAAYLHDAAYEVSPQRLWQGFLGSRHTIVTAWTRAGVYGVDFTGAGTGRGGPGPRYVQGLMPRMDGILQVMDVGETGDFDVSLCLEAGAMNRLLGDNGLWASAPRPGAHEMG